jgi:peptidoglycan/LPS O-acetylase OafA/YrhL
LIPTTEKEEILFLGAVPASISIHYYLTLFLGILLSIRAGLETFNEKPRLRLYSIFTLISFISCALIFAPVKKAYELGAINKSIPPIAELFAGWLILLVIIWILNLIQVSYTKSAKIWMVVFSILTILIFIGQNF